jgi:hypothetical protein
MGIPSELRAGDTVTWTLAATTDTLGNTISSPDWDVTYYLRMNTAGEGATVTSSDDGSGGWTFSIAAATTTGFNAGQWFWQAQASDGSSVITIGAGSLTVLPSLSYTSTPAAFDGRSQAEQDLEAVQTTIRGIIASKSKNYQVGSRQFTSLDLPQLIERESQLKAIVAREKRAEKIAAGLGDPGNLFVRFG